MRKTTLWERAGVLVSAAAAAALATSCSSDDETPEACGPDDACPCTTFLDCPLPGQMQCVAGICVMNDQDDTGGEDTDQPDAGDDATPGDVGQDPDVTADAVDVADADDDTTDTVDDTADIGVDTTDAADATEVGPDTPGDTGGEDTGSADYEPWLAYVELTGEFRRPQIWFARPDGTDVTELVTGDDREESPTWSPDGTRLAYSGLEPSGLATVVRIIDFSAGTISTVEPSIAVMRSLSWSPDGTQFVAQGLADLNPGTQDAVYLIDAVTGATTQVPNTTPDDSFPSWNPSTGEIWMVRETSPSFFEIVAIQPDGTGLRAVTSGVSVLGRFSIAADGSAWAYAQAVGGDTGQLVIGPDGAFIGQAEDANPALLPGNDRVALVRTGLDTDSEVVVVDRATSVVTRISNDDNANGMIVPGPVDADLVDVSNVPAP